MKKIIATTNAPAAIGPYSQAIDCGSFLVTSGQVPFDPKTGEFVPGGITRSRPARCSATSRPLWRPPA